MLRKANVRKARYGFFGSINTDSIIFLGKVVESIKDRPFTVEMDFNMGRHDIRIYTNDDEQAKWFEEQYL